jgi:glycosyltransferase involved in cell wall biosynthesis
MPTPLTVLIPCKDERMNIRPCIESVADLADEILIADSGSTDGTLDIVREIGGCRIIERDYVYSADFKNWAIPQATHQWVMVLDADERVSPELAGEIRQVLAAGSEDIDGYWMSYQCYFMGHPVHYSRWGTDSIRLFRRDKSRYRDRRVHAEIDLPDERLARFHGPLHHYSYWTYQEYIHKYDRYTTWGATDLHQRGRKAGAYDLLVRPFGNFLHRYLIRMGFLDGYPGLQLCMLQAFYSSFMKYGKLWEMQHGIAQPDPEAVPASEKFRIANGESPSAAGRAA